MKLRFELAAPWACETREELVIWRRPDWSGRIEVDPLGELPGDRKDWGVRVLSRGLPPGGDVQQTDLVNSVNHRGWPLTMVTTTVLDAARQPVETRFTMFYEMLYFGTTIAAIVDRSGVERWEAELRAPLIEAMLGVEPSFESAEVASIGELWDMTPRA
ncbi:MAG: hypothetical protein ACM31C_20680 [Acidobacteriota bacterium]